MSVVVVVVVVVVSGAVVGGVGVGVVNAILMPLLLVYRCCWSIDVIVTEMCWYHSTADETLSCCYYFPGRPSKAMRACLPARPLCFSPLPLYTGMFSTECSRNARSGGDLCSRPPVGLSPLPCYADIFRLNATGTDRRSIDTYVSNVFRSYPVTASVFG